MPLRGNRTADITMPELKHRLDVFFKIGDMVVSSLSYDTVMHKILEVARKVMGADVCSIRLLNQRLGTLELVASFGLYEKFLIQPKPIKVGESVVGRAVKDRKPYPVTDISKSHYKFPELAQACQLRSMLSVPIIARERVLGGITVYSKKPHRFNSGEIALLTAIASHAAIAIENANLYRDSLNALFTLAKTIEMKDTYTQGHSERVTRVAAAIADGLKLPPEQVNLIRQICPLHDLGKIGISERVLRKKGKLTPKEWVQIRRHPLIGADILGPIRLFGEGICLVRNHHERIDGKGYPDGLAGDDIPLLARIACVADAFDAMTSNRPYRKGMPLSDVLDEIRRCSGTQFDSDIAELFIDMINKGGLDPNLIIVE